MHSCYRFFDTVSEWIKDLLNFLTGMILWRRSISLLPQIQFNFCASYGIMRNMRQSNGEKQWHSTGGMSQRVGQQGALSLVFMNCDGIAGYRIKPIAKAGISGAYIQPPINLSTLTLY